MTLLSNIDELKKLDADLQKICENIDYKPGSIFRIASQYMANWGITITDENRDWIIKQARSSYIEEWQRGTSDSNEAIELAVNDAELSMGNLKLNVALAESIAEILPYIVKKNGSAIVCDIGAGAGDTTIAILDELERRDEEKCVNNTHFYLIEPSIRRIMVAKKSIEEHPYGKSVGNITLVESDDYNHLPIIKDSIFNIVYSNAVFHHMGFSDHFNILNKKIANDGALIIGDWYTTIWKYPSFLVPILRGLGLEHDRLEFFKARFSIRDQDERRFLKNLTAEQLEANEGMIKFELAIRERFRDIPPHSRLFFLEAHESLDDRRNKLTNAGFEIDLEMMRKHEYYACLKKAVRKTYPSKKSPGEHGEFASVITARKING